MTETRFPIVKMIEGCPRCKSTNVEEAEPDVQYSWVEIMNACHDCGFVWIETYTYAGITDEEGKELDENGNIIPKASEV